MCDCGKDGDAPQAVSNQAEYIPGKLYGGGLANSAILGAHIEAGGFQRVVQLCGEQVQPKLPEGVEFQWRDTPMDKLNYESGKALAEIINAEPEKKTLVICMSGGRAGTACVIAMTAAKGETDPRPTAEPFPWHKAPPLVAWMSDYAEKAAAAAAAAGGGAAAE